MRKNTLIPTINARMDVLVSICSDMMDTHDHYSGFVTSTFLSAFEAYAVDGKLSEENLLKYIEESIETSLRARKKTA